jgi:hypothetical protein
MGTADTDSETVTARSDGDRIIAEVNGSTIESDWETMKQLGKRVLSEAEDHKTDLQKEIEMGTGAHIRISCSDCGITREAEYERDLPFTPDEHVEFPDTDCERSAISVEAFCPRHGTIPLAYDECDSCASNRAVMNR